MAVLAVSAQQTEEIGGRLLARATTRGPLPGFFDRLFGQREAIARVDVAGLLSRDDLQRPAGQIVDKDFVRLLVRRNDRALRKVARVKPEREVVLVSSLRGLQRQARTDSRLRSGEAGVKRQQQKEYGDASATCHTVHSSCRNLPEGRCRARSRGQDRS